MESVITDMLKIIILYLVYFVICNENKIIANCFEDEKYKTISTMLKIYKLSLMKVRVSKEIDLVRVKYSCICLLPL